MARISLATSWSLAKAGASWRTTGSLAPTGRAKPLHSFDTTYGALAGWATAMRMTSSPPNLPVWPKTVLGSPSCWLTARLNTPVWRRYCQPVKARAPSCTSASV